MAVLVSFRGVLHSPLDRRAALGIARAFAARVGARTCRLTDLAEFDAEGELVDVADDAAFERWVRAEPGAAELRWGEVDDAWIPYVRPDGLVQDDGRLAGIALRDGDTGLELIANAWYDHMERGDVAAWLAERAGVAMYYVDPSWWPD